MLTSSQAEAAAISETEDIVKHVLSDFDHNEDFNAFDWNSTPVYHYIVSGSHVDPDLGREYVPLSEPITPYRRRKISKRNNKVRQLVSGLTQSLNSGKSIQVVQQELNSAQSYKAVHLAASPKELREILAVLFAADDCAPGCLDGGYDFLVGNAIIYGWEEALPCEGGVTDRYYSAEMKRHDAR